MKRYFRTLLCTGLISLLTLPAFAVPAKRQPITFSQPDGSNVTLTQYGDEHFHYYKALDGNIVLQDYDGWYRVVGNDGLMTEVKAADSNARKQKSATADSQNIDPETALKALRDKKNSRTLNKARLKAAPKKAITASKWDNADGHDLRDFPCEGEQNVLVILVNFTDVKWSFASNPQAEMTKILNTPGYSDYGFNGSAYDYFVTSSNGLFRPKFDVYGPAELSHPMSYYGRNDSYDEDTRPHEIVTEACKLLNDKIDFSKYDRNNDGFVDNVYVFYAGYGESDGGGSNTIWPHSFELQYAGTCPVYDGVTINKYACSNELNYYRDQKIKEMSGIGTFCHEFSHVLGLPDLYATDYTTSFTPAEYTLMDQGSYNNDGRTPPVYSIYERYALEWQKPIDITDASQINMLPMTRNGNAYRITINPSDPSEYYLFENRQKESWDSYLPGNGMLVWHIDFEASVWNQNVVNNTPSHQYVDIVEADNKRTEDDYAGDTFPGAAGVSEFTSSTTPALKNWNGATTTLGLKDIKNSLGVMSSFTVGNGGNSSSALNIATPEAKADEVGADKIKLSWNKVDNASSYILSVAATGTVNGAIVNEVLDEYSFKNIGDINSFEITGLKDSQTYNVYLYAMNGNNISGTRELRLTTSNADFSTVSPVISVSGVTDSEADITWPQIAEADHYYITVAKREYTSPAKVETIDFTDKVFPEGWNHALVWDSRENFCGEAAPSMKFVIQDSFLETKAFADDISEVSFWARVQRTDADLSLKLYSLDEDENMTEIADITNVSGSSEGSHITVDNIPEGVNHILWWYTFTTRDLALNIDDIKLTFNGDATDTELPSYNRRYLNTNSAHITGLDADKEYVAYVWAHDGKKESARSNVLKFRTMKNSGITNVTTSDAPAFSIIGNTVTTSSEVPFDIFSIDGRVISTGNIGFAQLPQKGIYILRCAGKALKICL